MSTWSLSPRPPKIVRRGMHIWIFKPGMLAHVSLIGGNCGYFVVMCHICTSADAAFIRQNLFGTHVFTAGRLRTLTASSLMGLSGHNRYFAMFRILASSCLLLLSICQLCEVFVIYLYAVDEEWRCAWFRRFHLRVFGAPPPFWRVGVLMAIRAFFCGREYVVLVFHDARY